MRVSIPLHTRLKDLEEKQILHLQILLKKAGFYPVELNGKPDAYTHISLNAFKESVYLYSENYVSIPTIFALERASRSFFVSADANDTNTTVDFMSNIPYKGSYFKELPIFKNTCKLEETYPTLCKEIQVILKEAGMYAGLIDGNINAEFKESFFNWCKLMNLERPGYIGPTTVCYLLDTAQQPSFFTGEGALNPKDIHKTMLLPNGEKVYVNASILFNGNFTWGELTSDGNRVPVNMEVLNNIFSLAERLESVRQVLGNRPISIISGYMTPSINKACYGTLSSQFVLGKAVDITYGGSLDKAYRLLNERWNGGLGDGRERGLLRLDTRSMRLRFGCINGCNRSYENLSKLKREY